MMCASGVAYSSGHARGCLHLKTRICARFIQQRHTTSHVSHVSGNANVGVNMASFTPKRVVVHRYTGAKSSTGMKIPTLYSNRGELARVYLFLV